MAKARKPISEHLAEASCGVLLSAQTLVSQCDDWHIRIAAADALASFGTTAGEQLKGLAHDPDENVRVAAVRVLLQLGDGDWLKHELGLSGSS